MTGDDHARLGEDAERLVIFEENKAFMRLADLAPGVRGCAALAFDRATQTFACTIYERRPQVCRDLERGSPACEGELATKGPRRLLLITPRP